MAVLSSHLLAFHLTRSCHHHLKEAAFGCVLKIKIQTFDIRATEGELSSELQMKLSIACEAFQVVKYYDIARALLRIKVRKHGTHSRAIHEIPGTRNVVGKNHLNIPAILIGIFPTAMFLALQTSTVDTLLH
nr:hypothetical protein [Ruegeria arenilitoris]